MKNILKAAVTTAALLASAGTAAAQAQTVVWWDFLSGGDGVRMKSLIDDFNKEHPDVQIEATTLEWVTASPPPHDNFAGVLPTVYRGPYEFAVPGAPNDYVMQTEPDPVEVAEGVGGNGHNGHKH